MPALTERVRAMLPPAVDQAAANAWHGARDFADRARLWRWVRMARRGPAGGVAFAGRGGAWETVRDVLRLEEGQDLPFSEAVHDPACAFACDAPLPGALHVPGGVRLLLRLTPGEDPLKLCSASTRGHLHKLMKLPWRWRRVTGRAEIARLQDEMLAPFALARHGERAYVVPLAEVERIARKGRLDELLLGDEPVGAHLGAPKLRDGERHFVSVRVGYPKRIFEDRKALGDANAANWLFASRAALEEGCAVHDMGLSPGTPDDGLLQFKRQRGGALDPEGSISTFWLRLPRAGASTLLWRSPVFALERGGLALHLGVPADLPDEELVQRFHTIGFTGLRAVRLHVARELDTGVVQAISAQFRKQEQPPAVEVIR